MAIPYSTLFGRLGRLIRWMNEFIDLQGTTLLGTDGTADDILDEYAARRDLVKNLQSSVESQASNVAGWVGTLKGVADTTLADLQTELNAPSNSAAVILPLLVADMIANAQDVQGNTISVPTVTAGGSNIGNGSLVVSTKTIAGIDDERIIDETVVLTCTADQFSGTAEGTERFQLVGFPTTSPNDYKPLGTGNGTISVADGSNRLLNGTFETFTTTDTPDSWTLGTGAVAGTTIKQESTNFHNGASALQLKGDGSTTSVTLSQTPASGVLQASTTYAVGVWLRKAGTVSAGSTLTVRVTGTGFSTVNLFNADPSTLTTSYALKTAFIHTPANLPSDIKVEIVWSAANTAGATAQVLVDDFVLATPLDFGHVQYALFGGSTGFVKGDSFEVVTANDNAGVFQTAFGRWWNIALPSHTGSGGPAISDALAT